MNLPAVQWSERGYIVGGKPTFFVSGEFHYFRVPKSDWKRRLQLFKEAGGNSIATYIPWLLHEPFEGDIRFGDESYRDLDGFLTLCRELEIYVTARPGPYQYSEMIFDGLPGWLCENYPEILARNVKGESFRKSSVSYLHPLFLEKARTWFARVSPIIAKHCVSRGGAVAFAQFDNELMGVHEWFGSWDYHPVTMGFGTEDGRFPRFLAVRYGNPENLNAAWETTFESFAAARPLDGGKPHTVGERRQAKDYQDFYFGTIAEYASTLVSWLREDGVDCDIVHNSANPYMNSYFLDLVDRLKSDGTPFILGSDHYYNLDQDWDQNNPTPKYACKNFYSSEQLRLLGMPPTVYELPGGSASDWPPVTPEDLYCSYMMNVAFGMKGCNYYIFTGGPNPENIGCFDDIYDFQAPIAADGTIRPTYDAMKRFGSFLQENSWLAAADKVADFHLGLVWEHSRSQHYFESDPSLGFSNKEAWLFFRKGLMTSALCSSYAPSIAEIDRGVSPIPTDKPVLLACGISLSTKGQQRLVDFVQAGGRLFISPLIPALDENFQPCTILSDFLGRPELVKHEPTVRINVGPIQNVHANGAVYRSETTPEGAEIFGVDERRGVTVGWRLKRGAGEVFWLGSSWKHGKNSHSALVTWLLQEMGVADKSTTCDNPFVWTSLRTDGEKAALFVMNLFSAPMKATVSAKIGPLTLSPSEVELAPMGVSVLNLS